MKKVSEITINKPQKERESSRFLGNITNDLEKRKFIHVANSRSGHNFIRENIMSWFGYEDLSDENIEYRNLENYNINRFSQDIKNLPLENYNNSIKVLTIRELLNWYTSYFYFFSKTIPENNFLLEEESYLKYRIINPVNNNYRLVIFDDELIKDRYLNRYKSKEEKLINQLNIGLDTWLINAKEFKNETNILKNFVHIYYDEFFINREYRMGICKQLGGTYNENKLNIITPQGNYSTFDSDKYQDDGQSMKDVLVRYKNWKEKDIKYLKILFNHDAFKYYSDNFIIDDDEKIFIIENI